LAAAVPQAQILAEEAVVAALGQALIIVFLVKHILLQLALAVHGVHHHYLVVIQHLIL